MNRETDPLPYQVESVTHHIAASDQDGRRRHQSEVRVSYPVQRSEMAILEEETRMLDVQQDDPSPFDRIRGTIRDLTIPEVNLFG